MLVKHDKSINTPQPYFIYRKRTNHHRHNYLFIRSVLVPLTRCGSLLCDREFPFREYRCRRPCQSCTVRPEFPVPVRTCRNSVVQEYPFCKAKLYGFNINF